MSVPSSVGLSRPAGHRGVSFSLVEVNRRSHDYLRLAIAIVFAVTAHCSYADSIPTFHITEVLMFMGPNDGSGDNVGFSFTGPGVEITGIGGMACFDWCSGLISDPNNAFTKPDIRYIV